MFNTNYTDHSIDNKVTSVKKHSVFNIKNNRLGKEISCLKGTIWITQEGDGVDRILTAGDIFQSRISGDILVEGLEDSSIRVSSLHKVEFIGFHKKVMETHQLASA